MAHQLWCELCDAKVPYDIKEEEFSVLVRNEEFSIHGKRALCPIHREELFHEEFEKRNQNVAFNLYRNKYGLVQPQEIKETRERYHLTQREYSYLLGFGEITISRYERGSLPTVAQNNIIKNSFTSNEFYSMLPDSHDKISETRLNEIKSEVYSYQDDESFIIEQLNQNIKKELQSGLDILKFNEVVSRFVADCKPYITKLNKLLFYADFYHYKQYGHSITGARYMRHHYGPVPIHYALLYELNDAVQRQETEYGEQVILNKNMKNVMQSCLTNEELETIHIVSAKFKSFTSKQISDYSHEEDAWKEVGEQEIIPCTYASSLSLN